MLTGKNLSEKNNYYSLNQSDFPDDCLIDFDMKIIDLFAEMDKKNLKISEQIQKEYFRVKELLGRTPSRMELFTYMEDDIYELAITHTKESPFKRYLSYQRSLKELTADEERHFIRMKMPVHYLQESGKGFFVKKEGAALALKDEMQEVIDNPVFIKQMKDVVEYRVMDYYRRTYKEKGD